MVLYCGSYVQKLHALYCFNLNLPILQKFKKYFASFLEKNKMFIHFSSQLPKKMFDILWPAISLTWQKYVLLPSRHGRLRVLFRKKILYKKFVKDCGPRKRTRKCTFMHMQVFMLPHYFIFSSYWDNIYLKNFIS